LARELNFGKTRKKDDDASDHEITANSHASIVDAIEARDEAAAAAAMLRVIDIGVRRIESTRKKRGSKK